MAQAQSDVTAEHKLPFFQRRSVQVVLPFCTSLALHAGIVVLALSVYEAVKTITVVKTEVGSPVDWGDGDPDTPIQTINHPFNGLGDDETRKRTQPYEMDNVDPNSMKFTPGEAAKINLNPGGGAGGEENALIGFGPGTVGKGGTGTGFGPGFGPGDGEAPKGAFGPYGPGGGGSPHLPPKKPGARKIVYVCDATGSMTPVFSGLRQELGREISSLRQTQFFNVIFFSDDKVLTLSPALVQADPDGKKKAEAFFSDVTSRGLTNPIPAIRAAFAQQPDVIYVLTDGFDQVNDLQTVVKEFDTLNKDRKVQVHTILIGSGENKELVDVLHTIAKQNNGTPKIVSKEEF